MRPNPLRVTWYWRSFDSDTASTHGHIESFRIRISIDGHLAHALRSQQRLRMAQQGPPGAASHASRIYPKVIEQRRLRVQVKLDESSYTAIGFSDETWSAQK